MPCQHRQQHHAAGGGRGIARGRRTIYTPWFWRVIMPVIRVIPEALFVRMKL